MEEYNSGEFHFEHIRLNFFFKSNQQMVGIKDDKDTHLWMIADKSNVSTIQKGVFQTMRSFFKNFIGTE